jgi:hypothetical protein
MGTSTPLDLIPDDPENVYIPGVVIQERRRGSHPRVIMRVNRGNYVVTIRSAGRRSRIQWRRLHRYEILSYD